MIGLELKNRDEMIFSKTPATEGGHRSLLVIPGSALWGAAAARCYGAGSGDTFRLLQSGAVRVTPGFPVTHTGLPAFPMPQLIHEPKHGGGGVIDQRLSGTAWNILYGPLNANGKEAQTEPLENRFLAADGSVVRPDLNEIGKAAAEEGGRRVAEEQFFQYAYLPAGSTWRAWVDADCAADEEVIANALCSGSLRLGRSKRREFGGTVHATRITHDDPRDLDFGKKATDRLILWCLSDIALVDRFGGPNLAPEPEDFGIPEFAGRLDPSRSVISTRRYAPYNSYLASRDREHAVISAGSVLVFSLKTELPLSVFKQGVGLWRERGLGLVWPNPLLLFKDRPGLTAAPSETSPRVADSRVINGGGKDSKPELSQAEDELVGVLKHRAVLMNEEARIADLAKSLVERFKGALTKADKNRAPTPGPTQWSRVAAAARQAGSLGDLNKNLFGDDGICVGETNAEWKEIRKPLTDALEECAGADLAEEARLSAMARAARQIGREWKGKGRR